MDGCERPHALALARSYLAPQLCDILRGPEATYVWHDVDRFRVNLREELLHNTSELLPHPLPHLLASMPDSFPNMDIVRLLTQPTQSKLHVLQTASRRWRVRMPDLGRLAKLCNVCFGWDFETIIQKFRQYVFPGLCVHYLLRVCSTPALQRVFR